MDGFSKGFGTTLKKEDARQFNPLSSNDTRPIGFEEKKDNPRPLSRKKRFPKFVFLSQRNEKEKRKRDICSFIISLPSLTFFFLHFYSPLHLTTYFHYHEYSSVASFSFIHRLLQIRPPFTIYPVTRFSLYNGQ